jgi:DNA-binding GntR family transcriptional regulator
MEMSKLLRPPSLTDQVFQILRDRIYNGTYLPGSKLPNESALIKEFSISRVTLRNAYAKLEEHKLIQRRQGTGTYIMEPLNLVDPRFLLMDYRDWITHHGYKPTISHHEARIVVTDSETAAQLGMDGSTRSLRLEQVWSADGEPVIHHISHVCLWVFEGIFTEEQIIQPGFAEPFFQFIKQRCNVPIDYLTSHIRPELYKNCDLPQEFSITSPDAALLVVENVGFTVEGKRVFHSIEHLAVWAAKIETLRRFA